MKAIEILKEEHKNILEYLLVIEDKCISALEGEEIDIEFFSTSIDFIRNYADDYHHRKEEDILFNYMIKYLGEIGESLINYGMKVEHDLARFYILEVEESLMEYEQSASSKLKLSIISNAMSYVYLLRRHIEKEDTLVYPYAEKHLNREIKDKIDRQSLVLDINPESKKIQERYLNTEKYKDRV